MPAVNRRKSAVNKTSSAQDDSGEWELAMAYGHHARVFDVCHSRKLEATFASASEDGSVRLWQAVPGTNTFQQRGCLWKDATVVLRVSWSPDERLLASGNADGTVRLWDASCIHAGSYGGSEVALLTGHPEEVYTCDFIDVPQRSEGSTMLTCSGTDLFMWDLDSGSLLTRTALKPSSDDSERFLFGCCQQPGSCSVGSISSDGSIQLWDCSSPYPRMRFDRHIVSGIGSAIAFNRDGTLLACTSRDGSVAVMDVRSMRVLAQCDIGCPGLSCCFVRLYKSGGETLAVVGGDSSVHLLNLLGGEGDVEQQLRIPPEWGDTSLLVVTSPHTHQACLTAAGEPSGLTSGDLLQPGGQPQDQLGGQDPENTSHDEDGLFGSCLSTEFPTLRGAPKPAEDGEEDDVDEEGDGNNFYRAPIFMWKWKDGLVSP